MQNVINILEAAATFSRLTLQAASIRCDVAALAGDTKGLYAAAMPALAALEAAADGLRSELFALSKDCGAALYADTANAAPGMAR